MLEGLITGLMSDLDRHWILCGLVRRFSEGLLQNVQQFQDVRGFLPLLRSWLVTPLLHAGCPDVQFLLS